MRTVTNDEPLMDPSLQGNDLAISHGTAFLAAVILAAVIGVIAVLSHNNPGSTGTSDAPSSPQHSKSALTDKQYAFARDLVRREIRRESAVVISATVTVSHGTVTDCDCGYPCMSGRLLNIKLIGNFPRIVISPVPPQQGTTPPDATVHAVILTADGKSGRACRISVQTGHVSPEPGAIPLALK